MLSIVSACSQILGASLNTSDVNLLMQKDGALLALGSLRKHLTKKAEYKGSLEPMLRVHVLPMLSSEHGFMRQRAAWIYSQFSGTIFRKCGKAGNGEAPSGKGDVASAQAVEQMQQVFPLVIGGLRDRDLPVRVATRWSTLASSAAPAFATLPTIAIRSDSPWQNERFQFEPIP